MDNLEHGLKNYGFWDKHVQITQFHNAYYLPGIMDCAKIDRNVWR